MKFEITFDGLIIDGLPQEEYDKRQRARRRDELVGNILFDVVSGELVLTPEERLYIYRQLGPSSTVHAAWTAKLYEACGCRAAARKLYEELGQHRKVGDAWLSEGREEEALACYRRPKQEEPRRKGPDFDRIIAIQFRRGDWAEAIKTFEASDWKPLDERQIVHGTFTTTAAPWSRAIAIAAARAVRLDDISLVKHIKTLFSLNQTAWEQLAAWAGAVSEDELAKSYEKMLPRVMKKPGVSLEEAAAAGATPRARNLAAWIQDAPDAAERVQKNFSAWLTNGDRAALNEAVAWIADAVTYDITKTALFEVTDRHKNFHGPTERVLELYRAHPYLMRYGIGHYLSLLIQDDLPFTGEDLLGGVFQALAFPGRDFTPETEDDISLRRLKACDDWAIQRLEDWQASDGKKMLEAARAALKDLPGFKVLDIRREDAWLKAMDEGIAWLGKRWKEELGAAVWKSEMMAFDLLKRAFKGRKVLQHDTPAWLTPQHLDIHLPEINLAVEYMGQQHYQPIEIWGGEEGLKHNQERDRRKAGLCAAAGVSLEYIRHDEDIGTRIAEIAVRHGGIAPTSTTGKRRRGR